MIAAAVEAEEYWRRPCSDRRKTLTYAHMTLCTFTNCDVGLGSLMLLVPETGDFVELILL
jgi:hypothetical protein